MRRSFINSYFICKHKTGRGPDSKGSGHVPIDGFAVAVLQAGVPGPLSGRFKSLEFLFRSRQVASQQTVS